MFQLSQCLSLLICPINMAMCIITIINVLISMLMIVSVITNMFIICLSVCAAITFVFFIMIFGMFIVVSLGLPLYLLHYGLHVSPLSVLTPSICRAADTL